MRFRLGLLQERAAIDKQIKAEQKAWDQERHKHRLATAPTEVEAGREEVASMARKQAKEKALHEASEKPKRPPKIRPMPDAKAIDSGANFVSEAFLLIVAVACVVGERWYSSKKESSRQEDVTGRLEGLEQYEKAIRRSMVEMEREVIRLRKKAGEPPLKAGRFLPKEVYELEEGEESKGEEAPRSWFARIAACIKWPRDEPVPDLEQEELKEKPKPTSTVSERSSSIVERITQIYPFSAPKNPEQVNPSSSSRVESSPKYSILSNDPKPK